MTLPSILAIAGCVALVISLLGGGIEAIKVIIPKISFWSRVSLGLLGSVLIGIAVWLYVATSLPSPIMPSPQLSSAITATSTTITQASAASSPSKTPMPPVTVTSAVSTPTLGIGSSMISPKDGMKLLYVPAGSFQMGSDSGDANEKPVHTMTLDAFWVDQTDVTNAMYAKCVNAGACQQPVNLSSFTRSSYYGNSEFDDYPVIYVDWNMADTYCKWASRQLPTEAQWEKAVRGIDGRIYPWGNNAPDDTLLNYSSNIGDTTEAGKYPNGASIYGALDMAGNVWQWVADWYEAYSGNTVSDSSYGTTYRVLRGGSWDNYNNIIVGSAYRYWSDPLYSDFLIGFRCARSQ